VRVLVWVLGREWEGGKSFDVIIRARGFCAGEDGWTPVEDGAVFVVVKAVAVAVAVAAVVVVVVEVAAEPDAVLVEFRTAAEVKSGLGRLSTLT
jgi:hypothetical protein